MFSYKPTLLSIHNSLCYVGKDISQIYCPNNNSIHGGTAYRIIQKIIAMNSNHNSH